MASIEIIVDGEKLNYKNDSLSFSFDNNSFADTFSVLHSRFPFLIVKDSISLSKLKVGHYKNKNQSYRIDCQVKQGNSIYQGRITVIQVLKTFIRCDVNFFSDAFTVLESKIGDFMPKFNIYGIPFQPYSEVVNIDFSDSLWERVSADLANTVYPDADYCLPRIQYENKYGMDLTDEDDWFFYNGYLNNYKINSTKIERNDFLEVSENDIRIRNKNVLSPMVFLLAPIKNAFESIGWVVEGDFANDEHIRKTFFYSENDQISKIEKPLETEDVNLYAIPWFGGSVSVPNKRYEFQFDKAGLYTINFKAIFKDEIVLDERRNGVSIIWPGEQARVFKPDIQNNEYDIRDQFEVSPDKVGENVRFVWSYPGGNNTDLEDMTLQIVKERDNTAYRFNPNVDLSRFVPDWTVVELLNALKNWRNVKVDFNDVKKSLSLNYNTDYLLKGDKIDLNRFSVYIKDYEPQPSDSFSLEYGDASEKLFIDAEKTDLNTIPFSETKVIKNKFKIIPFDGAKGVIDEDWEDKNGIGLGMLNQRNGIIPSIIDVINGNSLTLSGAGGIYERNWQKWIQFRINASRTVLQIDLSIHSIEEISLAQKIFIDDQIFLVKSIRYTEKNNGFLVDIEIEAVIF